MASVCVHALRITTCASVPIMMRTRTACLGVVWTGVYSEGSGHRTPPDSHPSGIRAPEIFHVLHPEVHEYAATAVVTAVVAAAAAGVSRVYVIQVRCCRTFPVYRH